MANKQEIIEHYGVLGMKWGVRRGRSISRKTTKTIRKQDKASKKGKASKITQKQREELVKNLDLERSVRILKGKSTNRLDKLINNYSDVTMSSLTSSATSIAIRNAVNNKNTAFTQREIINEKGDRSQRAAASNNYKQANAQVKTVTQSLRNDYQNIYNQDKANRG